MSGWAMGRRQARSPNGCRWCCGRSRSPPRSTAFVFLFRDNAHVTAVEVVNRSVGGSFVACGLIAWQRRRDSRIGPLMTLTGFVFVSEAVLSRRGLVGRLHAQPVVGELVDVVVRRPRSQLPQRRISSRTD